MLMSTQLPKLRYLPKCDKSVCDELGRVTYFTGRVVIFLYHASTS